ncbi:MAG: hypothetical protein PVJ55_11985 [Anaerolineae bacterium]|jgi:uncharacterized spore protein YtfJ
MKETLSELTVKSAESQEQAIGLMEKLLKVGQPSGVFGEPISVEGRTIITASEVNVGLGVGFGFGGGTGPTDEAGGQEAHKRRHAKMRDSDARVRLEGTGEGAGEAEGEESPESDEAAGMGGGGGGGGGASGRPVAVISISEDGVEVEPVVDATKIGLAFFTALGSMFFMLMKMRDAAKR